MLILEAGEDQARKGNGKKCRGTEVTAGKDQRAILENIKAVAGKARPTANAVLESQIIRCLNKCSQERSGLVEAAKRSEQVGERPAEPVEDVIAVVKGEDKLDQQ